MDEFPCYRWLYPCVPTHQCHQYQQRFRHSQRRRTSNSTRYTVSNPCTQMYSSLARPDSPRASAHVPTTCQRAACVPERVVPTLGFCGALCRGRGLGPEVTGPTPGRPGRLPGTLTVCRSVHGNGAYRYRYRYRYRGWRVRSASGDVELYFVVCVPCAMCMWDRHVARGALGGAEELYMHMCVCTCVWIDKNTDMHEMCICM